MKVVHLFSLLDCSDGEDFFFFFFFQMVRIECLLFVFNQVFQILVRAGWKCYGLEKNNLFAQGIGAGWWGQMWAKFFGGA